MIGIIRSYGPNNHQVFTWATSTFTDGITLFNIYDTASSTKKTGQMVTGSDLTIDLTWGACLSLSENAFCMIHRGSYSGFLQETRFYKEVSSSTWGDMAATYSHGSSTLLVSATDYDHFPIGMIHLSSGAMVAAFYLHDVDFGSFRYYFHYRNPAGAWQAPVTVDMAPNASTDLTQTFAMAQHPNGEIWFFRYAQGDSSIGLIKLVVSGANVAVVGSPNNQYIAAANSGDLLPFVGLPQLRVSIDPNRGGLLLAYQSNTSAAQGSATGTRLALCFIGPGPGTAKTFALMPTLWIEKSTGFEIGVDSGGPTVWVASSFLDANGSPTLVKVAAYNGGSWQFTDTAFAVPLYPIKDDFGSIYGGGICSGFAYID